VFANVGRGLPAAASPFAGAGVGVVGPITTELCRLFVEATRGRMPTYRKWLAPVYHPDRPTKEAADLTAAKR
jgi:hypothetical protein